MPLPYAGLFGAMLYPLNGFCCGCSVPTGVGIILLFHLAECVLYIISACSTLIFHQSFPLTAEWTFASQMFYTGWCLVGVPIILAATFGVFQRIEANVRLYLFYLIACFLLDIIWVGYYTTVADPCHQAMGDIIGAATEQFGHSFFCGALQIASYFFLGVVILLHVYCLWVVWSFCEDVHLGGNGPNLSELLPNRDYEIKTVRHMGDGPKKEIIGFAHTKLPGSYPSPYGATGPGIF